MRFILGFTMLCFTLTLSILTSVKSFGLDPASMKIDDEGLERLLAQYTNWSANVPDTERPGPDNVGSTCVAKMGSVNFLLDPFLKGTVTQNCRINSGSSLLFPFYYGWCDSGSTDLYGEKNYEKLLPCALGADAGIVTMEAWLDNTKIIDIKVNNVDPTNQKLLYNNLPNNGYYKEIRSHNPFNLTITNNTNVLSAYAHPEDFQNKPAMYTAVGHCFCGILGNLTTGNHELRYKTTIDGTQGLDKSDPKGWNQQTDVTYRLNVPE
jgi:hypothetical protein